MLDEHVSHAVADALRHRGIDVLTARDAGLLGAGDEAYVAYALRDARVIVTNDRDFLQLHQTRGAHAGIAYSDQGTRSIGELIASLVLIHEVLDPDEMVGRVEFL